MQCRFRLKGFFSKEVNAMGVRLFFLPLRKLRVGFAPEKKGVRGTERKKEWRVRESPAADVWNANQQWL